MVCLPSGGVGQIENRVAEMQVQRLQGGQTYRVIESLVDLEPDTTENVGR